MFCVLPIIFPHTMLCLLFSVSLQINNLNDSKYKCSAFIQLMFDRNEKLYVRKEHAVVVLLLNLSSIKS